MYHQTSQSSSSTSLLTQALTAEQHFQVDHPVDYQAMFALAQDRMHQSQQLQQQQQLHQGHLQQQLQLQHQHQQPLQTTHLQQDGALVNGGGQVGQQDPFAFDPSSLPLYSAQLPLSDLDLMGDMSGISLPSDLTHGSGADWSSYLVLNNFGETPGHVDMESLQLMSNNLGNEKWAMGQDASLSFDMQDSSSSLLHPTDQPPPPPQQQPQQQQQQPPPQTQQRSPQPQQHQLRQLQQDQQEQA
ncbi:hypothetical protein BGZ68_003401, partial [Mortierella alpina]